MTVDATLLGRADLREAVGLELASRNRLLPRRFDYWDLVSDSAIVERWLRPRLRRGFSQTAASVVFADKGQGGARPLHIMTLEDRVLYRALVNLIKESLPDRVRGRGNISTFKEAPLAV